MGVLTGVWQRWMLCSELARFFIWISLIQMKISQVHMPDNMLGNRIIRCAESVDVC